MAFFEKIFSISSETEFNEIALEMFDFQMRKNPLYAKFVNGVQQMSRRGGVHPRPCRNLSEIIANEDGGEPRPYDAPPITHYTQIPCLPIEFFKNHKILIDDVNTDQYFASSGTTGENTSKHFIADFELYEKSFTKGFSHFFGNPENYVILALLPNYLENQHSSLIYMMKSLIERTKSPYSGFFLSNFEELNAVINQVKGQRSKVKDTKKKPFTFYLLPFTDKTIILFGVSYALLDFAEKYPQKLENTLIFETGGMKGRREELSKTELHKRLCEAFGVEKIYSEYGMTELLSQAYSKGENKFSCPPWMRVFTRPLSNPLGVEKHHISGGINVIELANSNSCPFIATQDLGQTFSDNSFEILGRIENSDVRGCSLLVASS
jgi:hypothetical protein